MVETRFKAGNLQHSLECWKHLSQSELRRRSHKLHPYCSAEKNQLHIKPR